MEREVVLFAVDRRGGRHDHPEAPRVARGGEHMVGARGVHAVGVAGIEGRPFGRGHRRQVEHRRASLRRRPHGFQIADVTFDELRFPDEVFQVHQRAGGQIVEDPDRHALTDERMHQVRAHEAGTTRDQAAIAQRQVSPTEHLAVSRLAHGDTGVGAFHGGRA